MSAYWRRWLPLIINCINQEIKEIRGDDNSSDILKSSKLILLFSILISKNIILILDMIIGSKLQTPDKLMKKILTAFI